jgi:hypothetical protein
VEWWPYDRALRYAGAYGAMHNRDGADVRRPIALSTPAYRASTHSRACRTSWSGQEHAQDVERALVVIAASSGARSTDEAIAFIAELKTRGRYQRDVY